MKLIWEVKLGGVGRLTPGNARVAWAQQIGMD